MNGKKGFTIVEVVIVTVVICLITILALLNVENIQSRVRDASRSTKITIIAESLEKYFSKNGEYPGCTAMSQTPQTVTTNTLTGMNADALTSPSDASGTNSILGSCADLTVGTDKFAYIGDGSATCLTGAYCTRYTLKYYKEEANTIMMQNSRKGQLPITIPITAIGAISGTAQMGQTLTAGAITPAGATINYQWQSSNTLNGTYTDIAGANSNTFVLTLGQVGKYIKVTSNGTGAYSGTQTSVATAIVTDPDWITIGKQTWARTNLNTGTMINGTIAQTNNGGTNIVEKYCYNNMESNCTSYGALYQWDEAMKYSTTEGSQGICPTGSHIPSDNDWKILEMQLGMTQEQANATGFRGTNQGTQLKPYNPYGLNMSLAGYRNVSNTFNYLSTYGILWSSTELSSSASWYRLLDDSNAMVYRNPYDKAFGLSVRCLGN